MHYAGSRKAEQAEDDPLKIARVEIFLVGREWNNLVIVRLHTDDGLTGLGEGTMQWQARTVASAIEHMATR